MMPAIIRRTRSLVLPVWLAFSWLAVVSPARAELTLFQEGKTPGCIVVSTNALPSERYAAQELRHYLELITAAKFPVVTDAERAGTPQILLGDNALTRKFAPQIDFERLGSEGFVLRADSDRLIIAGGKPRGTLYGVYEFLEGKLGVRWFTPEIETVPRTNRISLPPMNVTFQPALDYREVYWTEMMRDANFAARHRLNGNHYRLTEQQGGRAAVYFPFVHSFDLLIPPELFQTHPEYFPLVDGKRINGYVQRCLANPEVVKLAITRVREWIRDHPDATIISVSQNDTGNWCRCQECQSLDEAEGSPAASLLNFVNAIAADIEADYPKVRLDTLAYQYTRKPPKSIRPRRNVIVRLCSIECCFAHPLANCSAETNHRFRDDILAWQPVAPLLYVWDYTPNFANYQQPFPNLGSLQPNVRFFTQHGVKGLFEQGNYSQGGNGELGPLRAYLLAKLLWNPNTDVARHTAEFLHAYFGPAAPKLHAYLDLLQNQVQNPGSHARIYDSPKAAYLNDEFLKTAEGMFNEAEELAGDESFRARVRTARLPIWYVQIATNRVKGEQRADLIRRFLEVARQAGISDISEGRSLEAWGK